jgi:hypothetical protein
MDSLYGQIPLHVACRCNLQTEALQLLLEYDSSKRSVLIPDDAGRLPLHGAFRFCPTTLTQIAIMGAGEKSSMEWILQAMVHGRLERVGLQTWKQDLVHKMILPLETSGKDEGDADTAYLLQETSSALRAFLEKAFLLELAIWKARCTLYEREHIVPDMPKQQDGSSSRVLSQSDKEDCRITSGADVIVPHVLSFLENEPISAVLVAATT